MKTRKRFKEIKPQLKVSAYMNIYLARAARLLTMMVIISLIKYLLSNF